MRARAAADEQTRNKPSREARGGGRVGTLVLSAKTELEQVLEDVGDLLRELARGGDDDGERADGAVDVGVAAEGEEVLNDGEEVGEGFVGAVGCT